jgi:hypothetical protein
MSDIDATNPNAAPLGPAPEVVQSNEPNSQPTELQTDDLTQDPSLLSQEDEDEELEHEGKVYRLPKALKPLVMMQKDYTQKTQAIAEEKRTAAAAAEAAKAEQQAAVAERQASREFLREAASVISINEQLAEFDTVDWDKLARDDPAKAQALQVHRTELERKRDTKLGELAAKEQARINAEAEADQKARARMAEGVQSIPGWSRDLAVKLTEHAVSKLGYTPAEIEGLRDPRVVKAIHGHYLSEQQATQARTETRVPSPTQQAAPVPVVGGRAAAAPVDLNKLSPEAFAAHRNKLDAQRRASRR